VRTIGLVATPIALFQQTLGVDADGFVGPSQWEPGVRYQPDIGPTSAQFVARFRERFGVDPDYPAAQAYAAGLIAQHCVAVAGTLADEALRAAADALALTTFYGPFQLDAATGQQVGHELVVVQWQAGQKEIVWPPRAATAAWCSRGRRTARPTWPPTGCCATAPRWPPSRPGRRRTPTRA
jgi:ABC-type branched-subunit amino acid transport system substrate-binding protein